MQILSTKEEWLYRLVIKNISINKRSETGYVIDIMLSGIPKDRYDADMVLKIIGNVQNKASEFLDGMELELISLEPKEVKQKLIEKLLDHYFGE